MLDRTPALPAGLCLLLCLNNHLRLIWTNHVRMAGPGNFTAASAKHNKVCQPFIRSCKCGPSFCWIPSRHLYLDLRSDNGVTTTHLSQGLIRATVHLFGSCSVLQYCTEVCSNLQGKIFPIQDLCLTIAGLSEILIRVLSDVYEIQLRFVSADGSVIF